MIDFECSPIILHSTTPDEQIEPIQYSSQPIVDIDAKNYKFKTRNKIGGKVSSKSITYSVIFIAAISIAAYSLKLLPL